MSSQKEGFFVESNSNDFNVKLNSFITSYKLSKSSILFVTDFDYTMTERFNYETKEKYNSLYDMNNTDVIEEGTQKAQKQKYLDLYKSYSKYQNDLSYPLEERIEKMYEWTDKVTSLPIHPKLRRESFTKMVERNKDKLIFRENIKEFYEKLIELDIPIIVVSGGIKEIVEDCIKTLNIKGLEEYIANNKFLILSNNYVFDKETGFCIGKNPNIIYSYNKSEQVKLAKDKYFPNIKNVFVLGDYCVDYKAIEKLNIEKDNIIGIGFLNYKPDEWIKGIDFSSDIELIDYKKTYDIICGNNMGYEKLINLILDKFE